jgi:hypothetical protein
VVVFEVKLSSALAQCGAAVRHPAWGWTRPLSRVSWVRRRGDDRCRCQGSPGEDCGCRGALARRVVRRRPSKVAFVPYYLFFFFALRVLLDVLLIIFDLFLFPVERKSLKGG